MTKLESQIRRVEQRLQEKPDPLLRDVLESLLELDRLNTVEGALDFFERTFCNPLEAAELTGIPYESIRQYVNNYVKFPDSRRTKLPCRTLGSSNKTVYVLTKKSLKNLA